MDQKVQIRFGEPEWGWLPVYFRYKEYNLEFRASNIFNDPVEDFCGAIISLMLTGEKQEVRFWLEPFTYVFEFSKVSERVTLRILEAEDYRMPVTNTNTYIEGSFEEIIEPLFAAIQLHASKCYEEHWSYLSRPLFSVLEIIMRKEGYSKYE